MKISRYLSLLAILTLISCRHPNEFKNLQNDAPHAVLRGTKYPKAGNIFATRINGQRTSFWRNSDIFRIPAGTNVCDTAFSSRQVTLGYQSVQFVANAGRDYVIARKVEPTFALPFTATPHSTTPNAWVIHDRRDLVNICETTSGGSHRVVAEAPKEDYVFGFTSAESAITEYHKRNP